MAFYRTKGNTDGQVNHSYKSRIVGILSHPDTRSSHNPSPVLCTKGKGSRKNKRRTSTCLIQGLLSSLFPPPAQYQ